MKKRFICVLVLSALGLAFGQPAIADPNPPIDADFSLDAPADIGGPGQCAFPFNLSSLNGKAKTIVLPDGRFIFTSPGLDVKVTNLNEPSKQVTLNVTGAFHVTTNAQGDTFYDVTGRNFLTDPFAGVVLAIGRFSFAFNAAGELIQPLAGKGTLTDVCGLID